MKNEHIFRASLYGMVCLATLCLWLGEDRPAPYPIVVVLCAVAAYIFTDHYGKLVIPRLLAPILGIIALALFVREELEQYAIDAVLPLGHLFIFLQVILFFHKKNANYYWYMLTMSFLQMMIAALHNNRLTFGILMSAYFVLALWTLTQFLIIRETARYQAADNVRAVALTLRQSFFHSVGSSVIVVFFALMLFLVIPRQGQTAWTQSSPFRPGQYLTGFDERIRLGQLGTILENDDEVMTVVMTDDRGNPYRPSEEPLWRGVVLAQYDSGSWERIVIDVQENFSPWQAAGDRYIKQEILVQAVHRDVLFGLRPALRGYTRTGTPLGLVRSDGTIVRPDTVPHGPLQYVIESSLDGSTHQPRELPANLVVNQPYLMAQMTQVPDSLREELLRYVADLNIPTNDDVALVRALLNHLQDPRQFAYTLNAAVENPDIDPVLDFLLNRKEGHCEYYASALALLLRAHGIPARIINGFKGGDWNDLIVKSVVVRQKHAHSWVEALVDPRNPRWITLDPTPGASRQQTMATVNPTPSLVRQVRDVSRQIWASYVLNFNSNEQEAAIYGPVRRVLVDRVRNMVESIRQTFAAQPRRFNWIAAAITSAITALLFGAGWIAVNWSRLRGTISRGNGQGIELGWWSIFLRVVQSLLRPWMHVENRTRHRVAFYEQLIDTLESHGLAKPAPWTPRQFAHWAADELRRVPERGSVADIPTHLVERFYQIRFGNRPLPDDEDEKVADMLRLLRTTLAGTEKYTSGQRA